METFTNLFNKIVSLGSIGLLVFFVLLLVILCIPKEKTITPYIKKHGLTISFLIALLSMVGSLIYSNIIGYPPCDLCWFQRVFMYPQVFLFGYALARKDNGILKYGFMLSFVGLLVALFHNYIYYVGQSPFPCSAAASCTARYVFEFGFMTIPLMALSSWLVLIAIFFVSKKKQ